MSPNKIRIERLNQIILEAERLIALANESQKSLFLQSEWGSYDKPKFAAVKRASIDLTRQLAKFRKPIL